MIGGMENRENPTVWLGGQGEVAGKDFQLLQKAFRQRWNITPEKREMIVDAMLAIVATSEDDRAKIGAAKVLVAADAINAKREETETAPQANLALMQQAAQQVLNEPEYLDYLRSRAIAADGDPGHVRTNGKPGALENGSAPGIHRPGSNGRH